MKSLWNYLLNKPVDAFFCRLSVCSVYSVPMTRTDWRIFTGVLLVSMMECISGLKRWTVFDSHGARGSRYQTAGRTRSIVLIVRIFLLFVISYRIFAFKAHRILLRACENSEETWWDVECSLFTCELAVATVCRFLQYVIDGYLLPACFIFSHCSPALIDIRTEFCRCGASIISHIYFNAFQLKKKPTGMSLLKKY